MTGQLRVFIPFAVACTIVGILVPSQVSAQSEILTNGGFESGSTGWSRSGSFYADSRFSVSRSGSGYAYLSRSDGSAGNNLTGTLYQEVDLPSSASSIDATFYYNVTTDETGSTPYDVLNVTLQSASGSHLTTIEVLSNVDGSTRGDYRRVSADLTAYRGQAVRLHFLGTTDGSLPTTFRIDDVSVRVTSESPPGSFTRQLHKNAL